MPEAAVVGHPRDRDMLRFEIAAHARSHALARLARERINALTGLESICPESTEWFGQMAAIRLPPMDFDRLATQLWEHYHIEIPLVFWNEQHFVRVSCQAYNSEDDIQTLVSALAEMLSS